MTLTAKTYGDGRGMITSAWLPTKWFVIASAILNLKQQQTLITSMYTEGVKMIKTSILLKFIIADDSA